MSLFVPPLAVGTQAPDFSALDEKGGQVALSALRGKNVVLVFYPADDTTICTPSSLCEFRDDWRQAQAKNAVVFGVNPASGQKHTKFRAKYDFPFPLLVDEKRRRSRSCIRRTAGSVPKRTVYLIGPDGNIRYAQSEGNPRPKKCWRRAG